MIYIDTLTNAQFAAGLVGVVFGAPALYSTFYWLAKAIVDFFWPVEDPYTIEMRRLDAKFAEQYKADMTDEQAREMNAERWID
jgi:hypothetical protein